MFLLIMSSFLSCKSEATKSTLDDIEKSIGTIEYDIKKMEELIPSSLCDSNHVAIWREGSIYYADYLSVIVIEKKQLKDNQLLCHYFTFDPNKPSNFRNWKYANTYELTLENDPFQYPLKDYTNFMKIDSIAFDCKCEGIEANVYFMKDFKSNKVYPINKGFNSTIIKTISKLFSQISKREHIQTFALTRDSIDYGEVGGLIQDKTFEYCIKEDGEVNSLQRRYRGK